MGAGASARRRRRPIYVYTRAQSVRANSVLRAKLGYVCLARRELIIGLLWLRHVPFNTLGCAVDICQECLRVMGWTAILGSADRAFWWLAMVPNAIDEQPPSL